MLAQLPRAESAYFDTVSQMVLDSWSRGRVVLLGDAAWCVTLFAGHGSSGSVRLSLRDLPLRFASYRPVSALLQRRLQLSA